MTTKVAILHMSICDFCSGLNIVASLPYNGGNLDNFTDIGCRAYAVALQWSASQSLVVSFLLSFVRYRVVTRKPYVFCMVLLVLFSS